MSKNLGFQFSSATCGFKKTKKPDLALVYSPIPCTYAGVFTINQVRAACIDENKESLKKHKKIKSIVINSGSANACTGKQGIKACKETKQITAKLLNIKPEEVLVASTGAIGLHLDMSKMKKGLELAAPKLDSKNFNAAARAILTTDRNLKTANVKTKDFEIFGFTKGAGMIHPNMATMLCYLFCDLNMPQSLLQSALRESTDISFNAITVDADMSTNDMVILLSNNTSKKVVKSKNDHLYHDFKMALDQICADLARKIALDGEGAKKLIEVIVTGAKSDDDAREIARSIASSNLFKCAVFGSDPNWGRAAARVGATKVKIDQDKLDIYLNMVCVFKQGNPLPFNKEKLNKEITKNKGVRIVVNLNLGNRAGSALGCDLTREYVNFNSAYFT
jgi:glutamate N-acetyltransferase/amino-acid N-acetyltransferase